MDYKQSSELTKRMSAAGNPIFWGQDPIFRTHAKMYIGDIMSMPSADGYDSVFMHNSHPVTKVDVMGVVVHADVKATYSSYVLDDGTGTIFCTYWPNDNQEEKFTSLPSGLKELASQFGTRDEGFSVGTALHVRGKLRRYQGNTEISVSYVRKMCDPYEEVHRMMELPVLYTQCYDKPPELSEIKHTSEAEQASMQKSFDRFLVEFLQKGCIKSVTEQILLSSAQLRTSFQEQQSQITDDNWGALVKQSLENLETDGIVFRSQESYIFVPLAQELEKQILSILKENSSDAGVQSRRILQELKKQVNFCHLSIQALNTALAAMESRSDVISVSENCYIAFS